MITISVANVRKLCPEADQAILAQLVTAFPKVLPIYGITTALRFDHFICQAAEESDHLKTLNEYGDAAYFNRNYGPGTKVGKRLGNVKAGDGARYHGRGMFQLTGRDNYRVFGKRIGVDLEGDPVRAADPEISLTIACEYWKAKGLNGLADRDDVKEITRRINGGRRGLAERIRLLDLAKKIWVPSAVRPARASIADVEDQAELPEAPIAQGPAPSPMTSPTVLATGTTIVGSIGSTVLAYIESPYALAAFALVVIAAAVVISRWLKNR